MNCLNAAVTPVAVHVTGYTRPGIYNMHCSWA